MQLLTLGLDDSYIQENKTLVPSPGLSSPFSLSFSCFDASSKCDSVNETISSALDAIASELVINATIQVDVSWTDLCADMPECRRLGSARPGIYSLFNNKAVMSKRMISGFHRQFGSKPREEETRILRILWPGSIRNMEDSILPTLKI